jgi:hypothetical protein
VLKREGRATGPPSRRDTEALALETVIDAYTNA